MKTIIDPSISYVIGDSLASYREAFLAVCPPARTYPKHTVFSRSGETGNALYFLLEGIVKVYTINPGGYVRILGYHRNSTLFAMDCVCGEAAVVTIESITNVKVLRVTWDTLRRVEAASPGFFEVLVKYYGSVLRLMCFDAESNSVCEATARLATFLCLFRKYGHLEDRSRIYLTQDELASAVNASHVQIARICGELKKRGIIRCDRGVVTILDPEALAKISEYGWSTGET